MPEEEAEKDERLAERARRGDGEAFTVLYARYFPRLYAVALRMLGDVDGAVEVAQETFLRFLEARPHPPLRHVRAYLYTIARHLAQDRLRRSRREIVFSQWASEGIIESVAEGTGPEQAVFRREQVRLLEEAMAGLAEEEQALLDLHLRHGLRPEELASVFHTSPGAIRTRLSRARDRLEEALTAAILIRHGPDRCMTLRALIDASGGPEGRLTPTVRRRLARHLAGCGRCQETRRRFLTAADWLAGLALPTPPAAAGPAARERLRRRVEAQAGAGALSVADAFAPWGAGALALKGMLIGLLVVGFLTAVAWAALVRTAPVEIQVENRNCPPLHFPAPLIRLAAAVPPFEIPSAVGRGATGRLRLPPAPVAVAQEEAAVRVEVYGLAFRFPIQGLAEARWDGAPLTVVPRWVSLASGTSHRLELVCR